MPSQEQMDALATARCRMALRDWHLRLGCEEADAVREYIETLERALYAACTLYHGYACFRTSGAIPMAIPPKRERIIRAALVPEPGEHT